MDIKISEITREGLTIWAFLYGTSGVSFESLQNAGITGYFLFEPAVESGLLNRIKSNVNGSNYKLTDLAMTMVKGVHDGRDN
jgi:hypothetical protein